MPWRRPQHITIMHTMASRVRHSTLYCSARSAEACGLREFYIDIKPPIKHLGHFHPDTSCWHRFPRGTLLLLSASIHSPQPSSPQELYQLAPYDKAQVRARLKQGGFSLSTEQYDLMPGPWPISHPADAPGHVLSDCSQTRSPRPPPRHRWSHSPYCTQIPPTSKDATTWRRQQEENQSSPKGLTGYLLDPDLFQLIARGSRLQLPNIPFHAAHWRQPACLRFQLHLASGNESRPVAKPCSMAQPNQSLSVQAPSLLGAHESWVAYATRPPYA